MGLISRVSSRTYRNYCHNNNMGIYQSKPELPKTQYTVTEAAATTSDIPPDNITKKETEVVVEKPTQEQVQEQQNIPEETTDENKGGLTVGEFFVDPRSPSANIQRTPVQS